MTKQKWIILLVALSLIGVAGAMLTRLHAVQRLGAPGVKTSVIPGSARLDIRLPELVLDYKSEVIPPDEGFLRYMPQDTSIAGRRYVGADGYRIVLSTVLMGTDRTSIHKPEFCLTSAGWQLDDSKAVVTSIPMQRPQPYDLPVQRFETSREVASKNGPQTVKGIYIFWFVSGDQLAATHWTRNWSMAKELLTTGVLQRWAYIACFALCRPGEEAATCHRMEKFIQSAAPQFQLVPGPRSAGTAVAETAANPLR
jgi:Protein of unknown function (DUF3485)